MKYLFSISILSLIILFSSCDPKKPETNKDEKLPIVGKLNKETGEVVNHTIRPFSFINQDSQIVTNATFEDKVYVSDFFFIKCPTICPVVKKNMKRIYDEFENNPNVALLSHSIDVRHDTVPALKQFAEALNIKTEKWHMVTGNRKEIFAISEDYVSSAKEGAQYEGGFDHSGYLVLVDKAGHVRSFKRGTDEEQSDMMMDDIRKLLKEYEEDKN